jgi:hypothetical protein
MRGSLGVFSLVRGWRCLRVVGAVVTCGAMRGSLGVFSLVRGRRCLRVVGDGWRLGDMRGSLGVFSLVRHLEMGSSRSYAEMPVGSRLSPLVCIDRYRQ